MAPNIWLNAATYFLLPLHPHPSNPTQVICQTGKNSPLIEHINVGIDQLDYEAGFCKQRNNEDKCKMVMKGGDAEMFICGPFSEMLPCKEIWRGIKEVRNHCKKNGRAAEEWDSLARASMQGLGRASIYLLVII